MKADKLVHQFCRTADGERVMVEQVVPADGGMPERVIVRFIEGDKVNRRGALIASTLTPLGREIPRDDDAAK